MGQVVETLISSHGVGKLVFIFPLPLSGLRERSFEKVLELATTDFVETNHSIRTNHSSCCGKFVVLNEE